MGVTNFTSISKHDKKETNQGLKCLIEGVKVSQQTKVLPVS